MSDTDANTCPPSTFSSLWKTEDWMAIWVGAILLFATFLTVGQPVADAEGKLKATSSLKSWLKTPDVWGENPVDSLSSPIKGAVPEVEGGPVPRKTLLPALGVTFLLLLAPFLLGSGLMGRGFLRFFPAFVVIWLLGVLSFVLSKQEVINQYNLEYVLWALVIGMVISNTVGAPSWLKPALCGEFYIKTGLVLLGAEVLFGQLVKMGIPGICVAWVVTPIVLITTFIFGQKVLKIKSPSLNMVISADMSVCGVSAAIATAAACKAKKEELSCAVGLSLAFTAVMMVVQPIFINSVKMDPVVAGAWIGGTIDSTGAVVAAGELVSKEAGEVASLIKMIQNVLIGVVAFGVAVYWTTVVEPGSQSQAPSLFEIWRRFPKFILGFVCASLVFSYLAQSGSEGAAMVTGTIDVTKMFRTWLFCLAFVCIGLETNFRTLSPYFVGGKPLVLYVCGQTLNLLLTFLMAYLMFGIIFKEKVSL
ncbi:YeiH family protein [Planctomicrobium sp. SH668]|uniref:YeiH family protein n=1 Tax=Planctomicrobium sp. SH668 TaxID=3448126 RepID=UPI003F5B877F